MIHNWNKIVENAISTAVALLVVSAGAIVWRAAMGVDQKIDDALEGVNQTIERVNQQGETLHTAVDVIEQEMARGFEKIQADLENLKSDQYVFEDHDLPESEPPLPKEGYDKGFIQQQLPRDYAAPLELKK